MGDSETSPRCARVSSIGLPSTRKNTFTCLRFIREGWSSWGRRRSEIRPIKKAINLIPEASYFLESNKVEIPLSQLELLSYPKPLASSSFFLLSRFFLRASWIPSTLSWQARPLIPHLDQVSKVKRVALRRKVLSYVSNPLGQYQEWFQLSLTCYCWINEPRLIPIPTWQWTMPLLDQPN